MQIDQLVNLVDSWDFSFTLFHPFPKLNMYQGNLPFLNGSVREPPSSSPFSWRIWITLTISTTGAAKMDLRWQKKHEAARRNFGCVRKHAVIIFATANTK